MKSLRNLLVAAVAVVAISSTASQVHAQYSFVGSWAVADGPYWQTNPTAMSGRMTAAFLFGGSYTDYAISTVGSNPNDINFKTFLDGYANITYLINPADQDYYLSSNGGGYNQSPSFSAFVNDNSPYFGSGESRNYAFRIDENSTVTPEPISMVLLGSGLAGVAAARRKKRAANVA